MGMSTTRLARLAASLPWIVLVTSAGAQQHAAPMAMTDEDMVKSAMAAAPEAVAAGATIVAVGADGKMRTLRQGSNGFTCLPDNPNSPGPDPMCGDANAMEWAAAWIGKKEPPAARSGSCTCSRAARTRATPTLMRKGRRPATTGSRPGRT